MRNHQVNLPASRYLVTFILLNHFLAAAVLIPLIMPLYVKFTAYLMIAYSLSYWLRRYFLRQGDKAILVLTKSEANDFWDLLSASGKVFPATLLPSSVVTPWFLILHFQLSTRQRLFVPILQDMVSPDQMRRLCVAIRNN